MNKIMIGAMLATLICMASVAPAMAQPAPFVITGHVSDSNGDPCNGAWVRVTNTNTSVSWDAENSSTSNYYKLALDSDDVSADDLLQFDASGCSQSNTTQHTVTQEEINDGGLFAFNITLKSTIVSCNSSGSEKDEFAPGEIVYVRGSGLAADTGYKLWIQDDPVGEGDTLNASVDPSGSQESVTTDGSGSFGPTEVWSDIPAGSQMNYDIVVDNQDGTYNAASDGIDSATMYGIVAPVPELASIVLFVVGLVVLVGIVRLGKRG